MTLFTALLLGLSAAVVLVRVEKLILGDTLSRGPRRWPSLRSLLAIGVAYSAWFVFQSTRHRMQRVSAEAEWLLYGEMAFVLAHLDIVFFTLESSRDSLVAANPRLWSLRRSLRLRRAVATAFGFGAATVATVTLPATWRALQITTVLLALTAVAVILVPIRGAAGSPSPKF